MRARIRGKIVVAAMTATIVACATTVTAAPKAAYEQAVGEAAAAWWISDECTGIGHLGKDYQQFVFAVSDAAVAQGLRRQKMRRLLFYGQTEWQQQMGKAVLADRGILHKGNKVFCGFAQKVAGTNDAIGRFLIKE